MNFTQYSKSSKLSNLKTLDHYANQFNKLLIVVYLVSLFKSFKLRSFIVNLTQMSKLSKLSNFKTLDR